MKSSLAHMKSLSVIRKARGLNQTQLAEAAGIEQPTVSKLENGWEGAALRTVYAVAAALNVEPYTLFLDGVTEAEVNLIETYRALPDGRKQGWQDMARAAKADVQSVDQ